MKIYLIVINNTTLKEYEKYYFETYPRRRVMPIKSPIPPSLNKWMIMPRRQMNNVKQSWKEFGIWLVNSYGYGNMKINKARITYTYYFPTKIRHDADNYNCKFIGDALVASGMLIDDDFNHVEVLYKGYHDKNNPRTEILIEVIE